MIRKTVESPAKLAIITVIKNPGNDLLSTYCSLSMQACKNFTWIIKDCCSADLSCNSFRINGADIHYINRPDNGIYDAMNQALFSEENNSEWNIFLNSGDTLFDELSIDRIIKVLYDVPSDIDLVYGDYYHELQRRMVVQPRKLSNFFLCRQNINHQTQIWRSNTLKQLGGFDVDFRIRADHDLLCKYFTRSSGSTFHLSFPIIKYKGGGFSDHNSILELKFSEFEAIRSKYFKKSLILSFKLWRIFTLLNLRNSLLRSSNPFAISLSRTFSRLSNLFNSRNLTSFF